MLTYILVFAVAGAFYWALLKLGKRRQRPGPALPPPSQSENTEWADNLEFMADVATRGGRRDRQDPVSDTKSTDTNSGGEDSGSGDGGGGDGGG